MKANSNTTVSSARKTITVEGTTVKVGGRVVKSSKEIRGLGILLLDTAKEIRTAESTAKKSLYEAKKAARSTQLASKKADREMKASARKVAQAAKVKAQLEALNAKLAKLEA